MRRHRTRHHQRLQNREAPGTAGRAARRHKRRSGKAAFGKFRTAAHHRERSCGCRKKSRGRGERLNLMIKEVAFVAIAVTDIPRSRKFYEEVLGLKAEGEYVDGQWIEYEIGPTT